MEVLSELCDPSACDLECVQACREVHGKDSPLQYLEGARLPRIREDCTQCLKCVRACPRAAITSNRLIKPTDSSVEPVPAERKKPGRPYEVADDYSQFSEANMIFARVRNDPSFEYYQKNEWFGSEDMIQRNIIGYSRFELELSVASWKLYDSRHAVTGPPTKDIDISNRFQPPVEAAPIEFAGLVKQAAKFYGAALVGIAEIDERWLYSANRSNENYDIPETFNRAVVMAIEMDYKGLSTSPAFPASASTAIGYSKMAFVEIGLSALIRRLGYGAIPCGNDIGLSVPLAIDAGLGQYGRHGLLITKKYGPRVRIAKVLTDMPLRTDEPDLSFCRAVTRFCEICEKCARSCPSQSIPYGRNQTWEGSTRSNNPGVKKWYVDVESCYGFWIENGSDCSNCVRSCPYNKRDGILHRFILRVVQYLPWLNRLVVKLDDLAGYGKQAPAASFWRKLSE